MTTETLKLYELSDAHRQLMDDIAEAGGEITPEQEQILDALETSTNGKVEAICMMIAEHQGLAGAIENEAYRLKQKATFHMNAVKRLKAYLFMCLERSKRDSVSTTTFNVRLQKSAPSARWVLLPAQIPDRFRRVVPEQVEFDARAALQAYSKGEPLPEGVEVTQGKHIVIR